MRISNSNLQLALGKTDDQTSPTASDKGIIKNAGDLYAGPVKESMVLSKSQSIQKVNSVEVIGSTKTTINKAIVIEGGSGLSLPNKRFLEKGGTLYPNPNRLKVGPIDQPVEIVNSEAVKTQVRTAVGSGLSESDKVILSDGGSIYPDFNKLRLQQLVIAKPGTTYGNPVEDAANKQPVEIPDSQKAIIGQPFSNLLALGGTEFPNPKKLQFGQLSNESSEVNQPEQGSDSFTNIKNPDGETPLADGTQNGDKLDGKYTSNVPDDSKKAEDPGKKEPQKRTGFFGETLHDSATCRDCKANAENTQKSQEMTRRGLEFILDQTVGTGPVPQIEKKVFLSWYYIPKLIGNIAKFVNAPLDRDLEQRLENKRTAIRLRDDKFLISRKEKAVAELQQQKQDQLEKLTRVQQEHRATLERMEKGRQEIIDKLNKANPPNGGAKYLGDPQARQRLEDAYFKKLKEIDEEIKYINNRMQPLQDDIERIKNRIKEAEEKLGLNAKPMPEIATDH